MSKVNEKIELMSKNISGEYYKKVLLQKKPLHTLNNFHNEFLVTPIDLMVMLHLFVNNFLLSSL